ncbi:MAG: ABC transporter substrate-binding protein [Syntrophales bacterium]|jgi:branched-chain amino acid transport system substrate-binding protein|nr:ABC transporter substrate-binding protein [Syntrophales bacterium]
MERKLYSNVLAILIFVTLIFLSSYPPLAAASRGSGDEPVTIAFIADLTNAAGQLPSAWMHVAAKQINESGGVLGRQVRVVTEDCKGQPNLAVEAYTRALIDHKATVVAIYPRSEIVLACESKAGEMYSDYPHIFLAVGAAAEQITSRIADNYEKWKFVFRDNYTVPAATLPIIRPVVDFYRSIGVRKVALLREDLMWLAGLFKTMPATKYHGEFAGLPDYAESLGMEVVYQKAVKYKAGMYSPLLEAIAAAGAEGIIFVGSDGNDFDVFIKQWVNSSARDLHMTLAGGCGGKFWERTGGKTLGVISRGSCLVPLLSGEHTPEVPDVMETAKKYGLDLCAQVLTSAYPDVFFIKKAITKAGGTDDMDALIKAMEETRNVGPMGPLHFEMTRIPPFFHGAAFVDMKDPSKEHPDGIRVDLVQFQKDGKLVHLNKPFPGVDGSPEYYKSPAELRK